MKIILMDAFFFTSFILCELIPDFKKFDKKQRASNNVFINVKPYYYKQIIYMY